VDKLETFMAIDVVDGQGKPVFVANEAQKRIVKAPAWAAFMPNERIYVVDLSNLPDNKATTAFFQRTMTINGKPYKLCRMWGSGVKDKRLFAVPEAFHPYTHMGWKAFARDGYRGGRALMSNAIYGAGVGNLRLEFRARGWRLGQTDHYIHDGCGVISRSYAEKIRFEGQPPIRLGTMNPSFQHAQVFSWEENKGWIVPFVQANLHKLESDAAEFAKLAMCDEEAKLEMLEAEELLLQHPYFTLTLTRKARELAARLTTTIPFRSDYRIAVPGPMVSVTGLNMLHRFPITMNGNIRVVDNGNDPEAVRLSKVVAEWQVVQHTITVPGRMTLKGDLVIVDDRDMPKGVDVIACVDDAKIMAEGVAIEDGMRYDFDNAYVGFVSWWDKGSAIMMPYDLISKMQGDYDGDGIARTTITQEIADYINNLPDQPVAKLSKNNKPLSDEACADMIRRSWLSAKLVGLGSNLKTTYAGLWSKMQDRALASFKFGVVDPDAFEKLVGLIIAYGTDGFKADDDVEKMLEAYNALQTQWGEKMFGVTKWKHDENVWAKVYPKVNGKHPWDVDMHMFQGTVAQIFALTVDRVTQMIKARGHTASRSPAEFLDWAPVQQDLTEWAIDKVNKYNEVARRVNPTTQMGRESLAAWCVTAREKWAKEKPNHTRMQMACAIWRAAHTKSNSNMSTSAAFVLYPEEAKVIVTTKPGITDLRKQSDGVVIGLARSVGSSMAARYENIPVRLVRVEYQSGKAVVQRVAMVALDWDGPLAKDANLPENTLGVFTPERKEPPLGEYVVTLERIGEERAYAAHLG